MERIQARPAEQVRAANTSLSPPPLVKMYETPNAEETDDWGAIVAANNFMLHPTIINMVQENQFNRMSKAEPNSHLST